jgi:omega-6 fatty acid desaturase (delta-12 desaturase)
MFDSRSAAETSANGHAPRTLRQVVAPYAKPETGRGVIQLLNTGLPFLAVMAGILYGADRNWMLALPIAPAAAVLLVRLFIIQHDCGHASFFTARWANDLLGRVLGLLTLTPYEFWRRSHASHHATSGNLDRRGIGDVTTLTVREYLALSRWRRFIYRLYRHPAVMFGIGPTYQFLIRHRIPDGHPLRRYREWCSVFGTNAAIVAVLALAALTIGLKPFLLGYLPVILLAASIGMWLFYVQHQFEDTYWEPSTHWDHQAAALEGCSFYDLPALLHWMTGYIGYHHVHHLSSRIPNYRLRECHEQNPELHRAKRLTLLDSLKCTRLALWDEDARKLVGFSRVRGDSERTQAPK